MLEDAAGIRRVVLACGTVDLRKGIDGLAMIIGDRYKQDLFEKGTASCSAGNVRTAVKDSYGWEQDSCSSINGLRTSGCHGRETQNKPRN